MPAKPALGGVLWLFIMWKIAGILLSAAMLVFLVVWLIPTQARLADGVVAPDLVLEGVLLGAEVVATVFGIALILRRHRSMRRFWIGLLGVSSVVVLLVTLLLGRGEEEVVFLLVPTVGWLAYWTIASRPRELQLATFWTRS